MRRVLSLFLAILMVLSTCMVGAVSVNATTDTGSTNTDTIKTDSANVTYKPKLPEGTAGVDYTEIKTADDFAALKDATAESVYVLTADITISASVAEFKGTLYGNGKTITTSVPVFTKLTGATVYDLTLAGTVAPTDDAATDDVNESAYVGALVRTATDVTLNHVVNEAAVSGTSYVGGIAGSLNGTSTMVGCVNKATVTGTSACAGGLVGCIYGNATIDNCVTMVAISATNNVGGLIGQVACDTALTVTNCIVPVNVTSSSVGGGLIGNITETSANAVIRIANCDVVGDVHATNITGGLVGSIATSTGSSITFENNTYEGNVTENNGKYANGAGGMVGRITATGSTVTVKNCKASGTIEAKKLYAGGMVAYVNNAESINIENCYTNATITATTYAGGMLGYLLDDNALTTNVTLKNNVADCDVSGSSVGGIAGYLYKKTATKKNCDVIAGNNTYIGTMTATGNAGGIVGVVNAGSNSKAYVWRKGIFTSNVVMATITSAADTGGVLGYGSWFDVNTSFSQNFVFSDITCSANKSVGGLWGYGRASDPFVADNNAVYVNFTTTAGSLMAIGGYKSHGGYVTSFVNNVYVGGLKPGESTTALYRVGVDYSSRTYTGNHYFLTEGAFDYAHYNAYNVPKLDEVTGEEVKGDDGKTVMVTMHEALDPERDIVMESATDNLVTALGDKWSYITSANAIVIGGKTVSEKNIPTTAKATLEAANAVLSGTSSAPVETITTEAEFLAMKPNGNYKLGANIKLTSSYGLPFFGTLDGDGKTITIEGAPVFCELGTATVKNLKIFGAVVNENEANVGALALEAGNVVLNNVEFSAGYVTATNNAGGLIGQVNGNATVTNCSVHADVTSTSGNAGGVICNVIGAGNDVTVQNCSSSGDVTGKLSVGGILSTVDISTTGSKLSLLDLTCSGSIKIPSVIKETSHVAGIIAKVKSGNSCIVDVKRCAFVGSELTLGRKDSEDETDTGSGGIVGSVTGATVGSVTTVDSCVTISDLTLSARAAGIVGSWDQRGTYKVTNCFFLGSLNIQKNSHEGGAIAAYAYGRGADDNIIEISNNAVYANIYRDSHNFSATLGYCNQDNKNVTIKNNVFVGTIETPAKALLSYQTGSSTTFSPDTFGNHYFCADIQYQHANKNGGLFVENPSNKMESAKSNLTDGLKDDKTTEVTELDNTVWTYIDGYRVGEEVLIGNIPTSAWNVLVAANVGTLSTEINNETEFLAMDPDGYYKLADSFELTQSYPETFTGILDGNGQTITAKGANIFKSLNNALIYDLNITGNPGTAAAVLTTTATDSMLVNVDATNVTVSTTSSAGAFVRDVVGSFTARNCDVTGIITSTKWYAGGLVGTATKSGSNATSLTFDDCSFSGTVTSVKGSGGIFGGNEDDIVADVIFNHCTTSGTVSTSGAGAGGIAGVVRKPTSFTVTNCASSANVTNTSYYAGGVVGAVNGAVLIDSCIATGTVVGKVNAGGVLGYFNPSTNNFSFEIKNCAYLGDRIEAPTVGGIVGCTAPQANVIKAAKSLVSSCVVSTEVRGSTYVGGLAGEMGGASGSDVFWGFENCLFLGSITSTGSGNQVGGIIGRAFGNNSSGVKINNCAVYANIQNSGTTASALLGYANSWSASTQFTNNVFVGTITSLKGTVYSFVCNNDDFAAEVSGNHYFFGEGMTLDYIVKGKTKVILPSSETTAQVKEMESATENLVSTLGDKWCYVSDYVVDGLPFTGNVPTAALNVLETVDTTIDVVDKTGPVIITDEDGFLNMDPNGYYKLGADIVLTTSYTKGVFAGILDGDGFKVTSANGAVFAAGLNGAFIYDLVVEASVSAADITSVGALAPTANDVTLLNIEATVTVSGSKIAGGLVGTVSGDVYVNHCTVSGTVTGESTKATQEDVFDSDGKKTGERVVDSERGALGVGGFFGNLETKSLTLLNSVSNADVTGQYWAGGFIGSTNLTGSEKIHLNDLSATGKIAVTSTTCTEAAAGGIVGHIEKAADILFAGCGFSGTIDSTQNLGGIAGIVEKTANRGKLHFLNCVYTGKQTAPAGAIAGGILGRNIQASGHKYLDFKTQSCVVVSDISAVNAAAGLAGNLGGTSGAKIAWVVNGNLVVGSVTSLESDAGGLTGYNYHGEPGFQQSNNAVYADISAKNWGYGLSSYGNLKHQAAFIKNNLFVGSVIAATTILTERGGNGIDNASAITGNLVYNTNKVGFDYLWYISGSTNAPVAQESILSSATENVSATLNTAAGEELWTYAFEGYRVGDKIIYGTLPADAYEILQATGLGAFATEIDSAEGFRDMEADGYYKLTADIEIPSSYANTFTGVLDGNGHKITVSDNAPVFSSLENATVYDLTIEATVEDTESEFAGALAPTANGVKLYNVDAKVSVSAAGIAGGLIGQVSGNVSIIDCSVTGSVTSTASYAGGVVGKFDNSPFAILTGDSFKGTVSASGRAGGIVGSLDLANHLGAVISSCSVIGSISGNEFVGGIAGYIVSMEGAGRNLKVENCLFVGDIISRSKAGGIVGQVNAAEGALWSKVSFNSNVVLGSMSSAHYAGGIVGDVRGWDGSATFDSNFVNLDRWLSTYTGDSPQYVGGLWGYSRDKKPIKVTNNGLYFNLESRGHSFQAIGGYANGNAGGSIYSNNLFVGSAVLNTINKYSDSQVIKALYHRGGGIMLQADKLQTNYYFFGNDTFDGAISSNSGALVALDEARDIKMSSATENVSAALGSAWTYAENLVFGSRVFTGNVPAAAYALLESNGIVAATTATPIYDADDFLNMDSFGSYVLMNNITLNSSYELPFYGYLDGNEKTITVNGKPVFESVSSATIVDLTVDGLISDTESTYVGAIANTAASVNLENVTVDVDVEAAGCAGGFFGTVTNVAKLNKITNKGDVTSAKMAGGILGYSTNNASVTYTECSNEGDVTGYSFAGGIVPFVSADTKFVKCSNSGNVKTIYDFTAAEGETIKFMGFAGGITAYAGSTVTVDGVISSVASDNDRSKVCNPKNYSEFVECSNSGNVTGMHYVGGILGATFDSAKFEYCSNEKNAVISGSDDSRLYVGGITGAVFVEGYFYRCDNAGEVYGNAMTGGIAGASGLSTTHIGPFGGQRFIGCTHTGLVSVTQVVGISDDVARVPGGIAGYCRSIRPYRAIVFDYCAVSGEIVLNRTEGCTSGTVAGVLVATVSSLSHAEFKYNYFTGKISVNGAGFTLFLPYQDSTQVPAENLEGNYSVKVGGLYYGFDKTGLVEFADDAIIKTKFADGSINYEKLLTILNESFDGQEVFVIDEDLQIAVLNKEYDVSKNIPQEAKPIGTAEEFLAMDPYDNYYLTADITLDSTYEYVFGGILNGDGYTITTSAPIFEAVEGAFIHDLTIDGSIEAEAMNVGALVNYADGIILNNVTNNADVLNKIGVSSDTDYTKATGGLVGKAVGTVTLTNCRNNGTITGAMPGGLVGSATSATFTATDCVNAGELTNYSTKVAVAGGILAFGDTGSFTFTGCYNTADLLFATATAYKVYAGGMLGFVRGADVELVVDDCANGGLVIANGTVGGIVGLAIGLVKSEFTDCQNAGRVVSKGEYAGGIAAWVSNSTDVTALNANANASITHYFKNCTNVADVYSFGRFAAGILTITLDGAKFEYCLNTGDVTTGAGNWAYSHATGIVSWTGARTDVYYCVNTGDITGAANAAGIGGYFYNIGGSADYHIVTGCVNTGNILSLYPSANIDRDAAVGIVRRAGSSGLKINGCVVAGSVKSVNGNAYGLFYYANSGENNVSGNVILLGPDDVSGVNTYLVASKANAIALDPENNKPAQLYVREGVFKTFAAHDDTVIPMPADYEYFFTDEALTDGTLLGSLNAYEIKNFLAKNSFVLNDGMPMHKSVVDVYGLKDSEAEDFIPEELIPEETPEEEEPEDTETSEPESSDTVEPESSETEPESSEVVDPGNDTTTEPENDTTKAPADDTTTGGDAGTDKPDDGKKKGCGSVVSATLALAAIALIAPAMVVIKKKDEE